MADLIRQVLTMLPEVEREPGTELPWGAEMWQIEATSARLGLPFPPELVDWLQVCNGPVIGPGGIHGVRPTVPPFARDIETHHGYLPDWCRPAYLPVAGDGCGSDYVIAAVPTCEGLHPVWFLSHVDRDRGRPSYLVASGLWSFLRFLFLEDLGDRGWPCEPSYILDLDPALNRIESAEFCWDG